MMVALLALLLWLAPAQAKDYPCGVGFGVAAGFTDVRDHWQWVDRGPLMPNGSPVLSMYCLPDLGKHAVIAGMQLAPWYIHFRIADERLVRQWWTGTLGYAFLLGKWRLGPQATGGHNGLGVGLYVGRTVGKRGHALDFRATNFPTDPILNVQTQLLYTFRIGQVREQKEGS